MGLSGIILIGIFVAPALAQRTGDDLCPADYSLVGAVCISDTTGDVVNPGPHA
jgi:hypothetical protein